jgi:hypothetical protein
MSILLYSKWKLPQNPDPRMKRYADCVKNNMEYFQKKEKEGLFKNRSGWADNTGTLISLTELENADAFAKLWSDVEFHKLMTQLFGCVDEAEIKVMRPAGFEPSTMKVLRPIV